MDPSERIGSACMKGPGAYFALTICEHLKPKTITKLYKKIVLLDLSVLYGCELT